MEIGTEGMGRDECEAGGKSGRKGTGGVRGDL